MEFKLSNIEEILEKSRKVLMESMEICTTPNRPALSDKTNQLRSQKEFENENYRVYLDKMKNVALLKQKDLERKSEIEFLSNEKTSEYQILQTKNSLIEKLKLEIAKSQIRIENEEIKKKISQNNDDICISRLKKSIEDFKYEKEVLENKYKTEYNNLNNNEILSIKGKIKDLQEKTYEKYQDLTQRLENLIKENEQLSNLISPKETSNVAKYKNLIKSLKKKLKSVITKYKGLKKNKEKPASQRHQSARRQNLGTRISSKNLHTRVKSNERNLTPKRPKLKNY